MGEMASGLEPAGEPSQIGPHSKKDPQKINKRQTSLFNYVSTEGSVRAIQSSLTPLSCLLLAHQVMSYISGSDVVQDDEAQEWF